jgi:hypothetical protein
VNASEHHVSRGRFLFTFLAAILSNMCSHFPASDRFDAVLEAAASMEILYPLLESIHPSLVPTCFQSLAAIAPCRATASEGQIVPRVPALPIVF